ncbi:hypothetical protein COCMIDRAFT_109612, partial [Bipolaris oryzae ATCC 44560]
WGGGEWGGSPCGCGPCPVHPIVIQLFGTQDLRNQAQHILLLEHASISSSTYRRWPQGKI